MINVSGLIGTRQEEDKCFHNKDAEMERWR